MLWTQWQINHFHFDLSGPVSLPIRRLDLEHPDPTRQVLKMKERLALSKCISVVHLRASRGRFIPVKVKTPALTRRIPVLIHSSNPESEFRVNLSRQSEISSASLLLRVWICVCIKHIISEVLQTTGNSWLIQRGSSGNRYGPAFLLRSNKASKSRALRPDGCSVNWELKARSEAASHWAALKRSISLIIKPNNELSWIIKRRAAIRRTHTSHIF